MNHPPKTGAKLSSHHRTIEFFSGTDDGQKMDDDEDEDEDDDHDIMMANHGKSWQMLVRCWSNAWQMMMIHIF